ncbi:tetratricopeptide repeat protein [Fibrobacterota bacterium]
MDKESKEKDLLQQYRKSKRLSKEIIWDLIIFYSKEGKPEESVKYAERQLELSTDLEDKALSYLTLGRLMEQLFDFPSASNYYRQALSLEPVNRATWYFIHNNLGYCLNQLSRFQEAEKYLRTAVKICRIFQHAYKNLGVCKQGLGQLPEAAQCFITAIKILPRDYRSLKHLEDLINRNPGLFIEVPGLKGELELCRMAVEKCAK